MPHSPVQIAVLDACVLYPATLRNFILRLAEEEAFIPVWSDEIVSEFVRGVLRDRPAVKPENLHRTVWLMNNAFPDALVVGYGNLIKTLTLPDPNDRHVLAAALKARAPTIVTLNLKDFPADTLSKHDVVAVHPDDFVAGLLKSDPKMVERALHEQQRSLKNPPVTVADLLKTLEAQGMVQTVKVLRKRQVVDIYKTMCDSPPRVQPDVCRESATQ